MRESDWREFDLFAPTPEHALLAETLREFVAREVEPQAADHDRREAFNHALFRSAGELGLLGVTLPEQYGGAGLDAVAAVQVYEALSSADPGFSLFDLADRLRARGWQVPAYTLPANCQESGKVCTRAYSRVVSGLVSSGWQRSVCFCAGLQVRVRLGSSQARRRAMPVRPPPRK